MNKDIRKLFLAIWALCSLPHFTVAQVSNTEEDTDTVRTLSLVDSYMDSLNIYRLRADSLQGIDNRSNARHKHMNYLRLFTPMTFYQDLASHRLSLDATQSLSEQTVDNALLSVWLFHPELVTGTQHQLEKAGKTIEDTRQVEATLTNITEKSTAVYEPEADKVDVVVKKPNFWKFSGDFNMHVNQLAFSGNWYQSHENNYNMLSTLTLKANYNNKQKVKWDNTLEVRLGMQTTKADTLRGMKTTEDMLRYTGNLGLQAIKKWDYTFQIITTTQTLKGYKVNNPVVYSDIFSPINIKASVGMKYNFSLVKKKLTGSVNFGALAYSWRYCGRDRLVTSFGINEGHHTLKDYGSDLTVNSTYKFTNDISWTMRLYAFTSYKHALVELENTVNFKINKYFTSTFYFYPRFDDSRTRDEHHGYWGFKETFSFGLSYSF